MDNKYLVHKEPGKEAIIVKSDNVTLEQLQRLVGGYIGIVPNYNLDEEVTLLCNEDAKMHRNWKGNVAVSGIEIAGPVTVCGRKYVEDGWNFVGLSKEQASTLKASLNTLSV